MLVKAQFEYVHPSRFRPPRKDLRDRTASAFVSVFTCEFRPDVRKRGVVVPVLSFREGDGLVVIDGWTRVQAALLEGLDLVPAMIYPAPLSDSDLEVAAWRANAKRQDMTFKELALFYLRTKTATGWSNTRLAAELDVDKSEITRHLRPIERLPQALIDKAGRGDGLICDRALYALSQLDDVPAIMGLADRYTNGMLCVESLEDEVKALRGVKKRKSLRPRTYKDGCITVTYPAEMSPELLADWFAQQAKKLKRSA